MHQKDIPPSSMSPSRHTAIAALCATWSTSLIVLMCAALVLRRRTRATLQVPPQVMAALSGLLVGLSLLVLLPTALEGLRKTATPEDRVLLSFAFGPVAMYFFHHVVLGHNCDHSGNGESQQQPAWWQKKDDCSGCETCAPAGAPGIAPGAAPMALPPLPSRMTTPNASKCARACGIVLRVSAWAAHALLDGFMLGSAQSVGVVGALSLPVALCACQDATSLTLGHVARGEPAHEAIAAALILALCFPIGTISALILSHWPSAGMVSNDTLLHVRAFTAGIFLYMAIFEFSPPSAHGRYQSLGWLIAFCVGLSLAWAAEAFEDAMVESGTAALPLYAGPPHLDTSGHWVRDAPAMVGRGVDASALIPPSA